MPYGRTHFAAIDDGRTVNGRTAVRPYGPTLLGSRPCPIYR